MHAIKTITLVMPLNLGSVNCYLIQVEDGFILIDTGVSSKRAALDRELEQAGCKPGDLKLIVITHGDFDHTGNAAYLREKYGAQIAMHLADAGMAKDGDMFHNRKAPNKIVQLLAPTLFGFGKSKRFEADILLEDGFDLSPHGLDAEVISLPGHSKGSIGVHTSDGYLFCGDLLENVKKPAFNSLMDEREAGNASFARLKGISIKSIYPGHGNAFQLDDLSS